MPTVVCQVMEMLAKETGWVFLVYGIGPNPSNDGRIYMKQLVRFANEIFDSLIVNVIDSSLAAMKS
jgi:hypothetical protein